MGLWRVSAVQQEAASLLACDVQAFLRTQASFDWSRGRKSIFECIQELEISVRNRKFDEGPKKVPAKPVDPNRVSLPARASTCRPEDYLDAGKVEELSRIWSLVLPESQWPDPLPSMCHWITKEDEAVLRSSLFAIGLAQPIPADEVPRSPDGRLLSSGAA